MTTKKFFINTLYLLSILAPYYTISTLFSYPLSNECLYGCLSIYVVANLINICLYVKSENFTENKRSA